MSGIQLLVNIVRGDPEDSSQYEHIRDPMTVGAVIPEVDDEDKGELKAMVFGKIMQALVEALEDDFQIGTTLIIEYLADEVTIRGQNQEIH